MDQKKTVGDAKSNMTFQMPLHYPRYTRKDYQEMPEWMLDHLLSAYGLPTQGDVDYKREFAMGAFLWPANIVQVSSSCHSSLS
ncbi:hypothetical protein Leryth_007454 [Lithospermum erythrorhizon]|uniref:DUF7722 domain-containing protein n=1 Tax=Lithospermum erythrorhizon TaxID=34254 RepID=A0AAV3NQN2_LITER|nr:hypothetical protein Leryth_007454 [Lithospermum erythrorhizon]